MKPQQHALTAKFVAQFLNPANRPAKGDLIIRDTGAMKGFGIRITAGAVSFFVQRKMGGRVSVRRTIGSYPEMTVAQARETAVEWRQLMSKGTDPLLIKRANQKNTDAEWDRIERTFGKVYEKYIEAKKDGSTELTIKDRQKVIPKMEKSSLWKTPFHEVDYDLVSENMSKQFAASLSTGWRIYRYCRAAYADEASNQKIFGNPFSEWRRKKKPKLLKRREIVLPTGEEAGKLWLAELVNLRDHSESYVAITADYLLCVLLWGGRKTETQKLRREDINFQHRFAMFKEENTKSKVAHYFPLTPWAEKILTQRIKKNGDQEETWVFPSRVQGKHIVDIRRVLEMLTEASGLRIGAHDLRRTFASEVLADSNSNLFVVKMAMNHSDVSQDVTVGYLGTKAKVETLRPVYEQRERRLMQLAGVRASEPVIPDDALKIIREAATNPELKKLLQKALR